MHLLFLPFQSHFLFVEVENIGDVKLRVGKFTKGKKQSEAFYAVIGDDVERKSTVNSRLARNFIYLSFSLIVSNTTRTST